MFYIVLAVILLLALVIAVASAVLSADPDVKSGAAIVSGGLVLVLIVITLAFSATTVSARSVGIQTSFGKYDATLSNGFHFTAPWAGVEEFSTQVQYLTLDDGDTVNLTFSGGGQGNVDAVVRWRIDKEDAQNLWKKYKSFDNVRDNLVKSASQESFRVVLGKYTPNDARSGENLRAITTAVKADLDRVLATDGVTIDSVSVKGIALSDATQKSLENVVVANNNIERAKSEQERAKIDAVTAEIRAKSGSLSGAALVRYCLEVTNSWDTKKNGNLPAGWNCFSPSTLVAAK